MLWFEVTNHESGESKPMGSEIVMTENLSSKFVH